MIMMHHLVASWDRRVLILFLEIVILEKIRKMSVRHMMTDKTEICRRGRIGRDAMAGDGPVGKRRKK